MGKIIYASIVTAFSKKAIGTRVVDPLGFTALLEQAVERHDFSKDAVPGQGTIQMPAEAFTMVASGVGKRTTNPRDYVLREYRGVVSLFLKRPHAAPVEALCVIVYTRKAYLADPDVQKNHQEAIRIEASDATHVLVAVLASAGPKPQLSYERFTKNVAGGNREFDPNQGATLEKVIDKAKLVAEYGDTWCTVAD